MLTTSKSSSCLPNSLKLPPKSPKIKPNLQDDPEQSLNSGRGNLNAIESTFKKSKLSSSCYAARQHHHMSSGLESIDEINELESFLPDR